MAVWAIHWSRLKKSLTNSGAGASIVLIVNFFTIMSQATQPSCRPPVLNGQWRNRVHIGLSWGSHLLIALLLCAAAGGASANQTHAAFAVAVTLHTVVKPLSAEQLCHNGRPIQTLGATIQIDCPRMHPAAPGGPAARVTPAAAGTVEPRQLPPEVTVTF